MRNSLARIFRSFFMYFLKFYRKSRLISYGNMITRRSSFVLTLLKVITIVIFLIYFISTLVYLLPVLGIVKRRTFLSLDDAVARFEGRQKCYMEYMSLNISSPRLPPELEMMTSTNCEYQNKLCAICG